MKAFTDDEMTALLPTAKAYSVMILKQGPNFTDDTAPAVIWEHGRRNFGLRHDGVLAVVLPVTDGSDVCGVGVFTGTVEETVALMNDDPSSARRTRSSRCGRHPCPTPGPHPTVVGHSAWLARGTTEMARICRPGRVLHPARERPAPNRRVTAQSLPAGRILASWM